MGFNFVEKSYDVLTLDLRNGFIAQPGEWDSVLPAQAAPALKKLEALNTQPGPGFHGGGALHHGPTAVRVGPWSDHRKAIYLRQL